jgi:phytoene dehydrogenase-like protein
MNREEWMSDQKNWDVIIIGAGLTGLSVGAMLANVGKKVLILEKNAQAGGRMMGNVIKGHVLDNAGHGPSLAGNLEEIWRRLGLKFPAGIALSRTQIYRNKEWRNLVDFMNRGELKKIFKEIAETSMEDMDKVYDIPLKDWLSARTQDEGVHDFFRMIAIVTFAGNTIEAISAGATLVLLKEIAENTKGFGNQGNYQLMAGGVHNTLIKGLFEFVKEKGIEIRFNSIVRHTIIEDGKVRGVRVDAEEPLVPSHFPRTETLRAPIVVCTLPMWDVFKVISQDDLPFWYVDWIKRIQYKGGTWWAIHHGLKGHLDDWPDEKLAKIVLPKDHPRGMFMLTNYYPSYAPEGQSQLAHFLSADRNQVPNLFHVGQAKVWKQMDVFFELFLQDLKSLYPDLEERILWETRHIGIYTMVEEPGISRLGRPYMQPPGVEGLYLAGDTMREGSGTGMQAAAAAALTCVDRIAGNQG